MKKYFFVLYFLILFFIGNFSSSQAWCDSKPKNISYQDDFLAVCHLFANKYVFVEEKLHKSRQEFSQDCAALANQIKPANNGLAYIEALKKIRSWFPDGHLGWRLKDSFFDVEKKIQTSFLPIIISTQKGYPFVAKRTDEWAQIPIGSRVLSINHKPVETVLAEQIKCAPQSTLLSSREVAARTLSIYSEDFPCGLAPPSSVSTTLLYPDHTQHTVTIPWQTERPYRMTRNGYPSLERIPEDSRLFFKKERLGLIASVIKTQNQKVGVLHPKDFSSFSWDAKSLKKAIRYLKRKNIELLVIDLKDTGGGAEQRIPVFLEQLGIEFPTGIDVVTVDPQTGNKIITYDTTDFDAPRQSVVWTGPIIVYTNPICGSACDFFVAIFKAAKRGIVIGQTTAGRAATYNTHSTTYVEFDISEEDFIFPFAKTSFEGRGVEPDVWCEDDLLECLKKLESKNP